MLVSQGRPVAEAIRTIGMTPFTSYRWRKEFGRLKSDQVKRLKDLENENERLRKAASDLTLEKLILRGERVRATGPSAHANASPSLLFASSPCLWADTGSSRRLRRATMLTERVQA